MTLPLGFDGIDAHEPLDVGVPVYLMLRWLRYGGGGVVGSGASCAHCETLVRITSSVVQAVSL
jgi:hypothetical protein